MKRIFALIGMLLMFYGITWAQFYDENDRLFQFEAVAGGSLSNWSDTNGNAKWHPGFHVGFRGTYNFKSLERTPYVNAGLLLSLKGVRSDYISSDAYYLDIPVHAGYSVGITNGVNIFGEAGPYLGIGLFGKTAGEETFDILKRVDFGLGGRVGLEFNKRFNVSFGFDYGLLEIRDDWEFKNLNMTLQLGVKF